jgi:FkbM family methyltransferase
MLRLVVGNKRRYKLSAERELYFEGLWNKHLKVYRKIRPDSARLRFKMIKYDFEFYCRANRHDFTTMVFGENHIIENYFTPKKGDIVVDIGAHIGLYTLVASKRVDVQGKVVAIEADPENFEMLSRNIHLNKLENVIPLNYAAYSEEKKMKLYLPTHEGSLSGSVYNTLIEERAHGIEKFVEVDTATLDFLLESNGIKQQDVNWIKIDVEGAEFEVLKGATKTLSESHNLTLLIEVHKVNEQQTLYEEIIELLNLYGIRVYFEQSYSSGEKHLLAKKQR